MDQDKLHEQLKKAAQNAESREFPALEKVWARVEDKLDHKALKRQNRRWKLMAAAASILLIASLGYQFFKPQDILIEPKTQVVATDTTKTKRVIPNPEVQTIVAVPETENPQIRKDAQTVLQKQIQSQQTVVNHAPLPAAVKEMPLAKPAAEAISASKETAAKDQDDAAKSMERKFEARSVRHEAESNFAPNKQRIQIGKKQDPLVVINGNAVQNAPASETLAKLDPEMLDSIEVLPNPLYIINGVEYSEESLFGPHPTSPYAPLNKQEIESLTIYKSQEAVSRYGQKGAQGVVVITTKKK